MIELTNSERRILSYLATNGPAFGRQMSEITGLSSSTVSNAPRSLEKKGLVSRIVILEPRARMEYSLTVFGLIYALIIIRPEEWPSIMKAWPALVPLVTDKWGFFVSAGVEDLAMRKLKTAAREMFTLALIETPAVAADLICSADIFSARFYCSDIGTYNDEERLRWAEACRKDPRIRDYFSMSGNVSIIAHAKEILATEIMLDTLEDNKDKKKRKRFLTDDFLRRLPLRGTAAYRSMMSHLFHREGMSPPQPLFSKIMSSNPEMSSEAHGHTLQSDSET